MMLSESYATKAGALLDDPTRAVSLFGDGDEGNKSLSTIVTALGKHDKLIKRKVALS